jgi:hypothetical protein
MDPLFVIAILGGSVSAGIGAVWHRRTREGRLVRRQLRALPEAGPTVSAGTEVRISGIVRALDTPLLAPLSRQPCVLYRARVRAFGGNGSGTSMQRQAPPKLPRVGEDFRLQRFLVDRGAAGTVVVDSEAAELALPRTPRRALQADQCSAFQVRHGIHHSFRPVIEEIVLSPGATVTIAGFAMFDVEAPGGSPELGFRDAPPPTLRITGSRAHPLRIARA